MKKNVKKFFKKTKKHVRKFRDTVTSFKEEQKKSKSPKNLKPPTKKEPDHVVVKFS